MRRLAAAIAALGAVLPSAARAAECAVALAMALDISSSVNAREYAIQKDGLAAALKHPDVRDAALLEPGSVWLAAYEWSGWQQQDVIVGWTRIDGEADLDAVANRLFAHRRRYAEFSTALGDALEFGAQLFSALPTTCRRNVIDVSGDGVSNEGDDATAVRDGPALAQVTVNGLVIKGASPDPEAFYRDNVIRGPGAFLMVARNGFEDYPDLIVGKLIRELQPPLFIGEAPRGAAIR